MRRIQILVVVLMLLSLSINVCFAQSINEPVRVIQTLEKKSITLYNNVGVASAPAGTRIVIVLIDPADKNRYIDQSCLSLIKGTKMIDCQALGDYKKGFFNRQLSIPLIRNNKLFEGSKGTVKIKEENLAAAFVVLNSDSIKNLSLLYSYLDTIINLDTLLSVELIGGIHLKIKEFKVFPEASLTGHDVVYLVVHIKNESSEPFNIAGNTFRLGVPVHATSAIEPDFGWDELNNLIKYYDDETPDNKNTGMSVTIPPAKSMNIELLYETGKYNPQWNKLGFFKYFLVPLM